MTLKLAEGPFVDPYAHLNEPVQASFSDSTFLERQAESTTAFEVEKQASQD